MARVDLLDTNEVARLLNLRPASVKDWTARRGISHIRLANGRYRYPAAPVIAETRHHPVARLARFIRNPLNV